MSRVLYSATISLDGYMAGPDRDMSWLRPFLGPNPQVEALQEEIKALLVGANTFRGDDPNRGTDAEGNFSGTGPGRHSSSPTTPRRPDTRNDLPPRRPVRTRRSPSCRRRAT